jgi:hypothetical protein
LNKDTIQEWLNDLIPLEITINTETISKLDSRMVQACKELYAFIARLYNDMYHNPTEYGLIGENKEIFDRALGVLHSFIWQMIPDGELMSDSLVWIPDFEQKINHHKGIAKLFSKTPFSMRQRLNLLQHCGLHIEDKEDGACVTNSEYPNMFLPLQSLRQKKKKNYAGSVIYQNCEFRLIANPKYQPTLADIMYNRTSPETEDLLHRLDAYAKERKFIPENRVKECIYYRYKDKRIMTITVRRNLVYILIDIGDIDHINQMQYSSDFKEFIKKNMGYCTNCFPHHGGGKKVTLFDKQVGVCGRESLNVKNLKPNQFEYITQALDFGCNVVDDSRK